MVSFHSLEDRIVKRFLKTRSQYAARPSRHSPVFEAQAPTFELLSRKAILPMEAERIKTAVPALQNYALPDAPMHLGYTMTQKGLDLNRPIFV